ncbi:MAG: hypothetical protein HY537_03520 [Deltaproteobacteria bacterium]|nr:hypothetical protein [Deltaproteobacteria bacterium]
MGRGSQVVPSLLIILSILFAPAVGGHSPCGEVLQQRTALVKLELAKYRKELWLHQRMLIKLKEKKVIDTAVDLCSTNGWCSQPQVRQAVEEAAAKVVGPSVKIVGFLVSGSSSTLALWGLMKLNEVLPDAQKWVVVPLTGFLTPFIFQLMSFVSDNYGAALRNISFLLGTLPKTKDKGAERFHEHWVSSNVALTSTEQTGRGVENNADIASQEALSEAFHTYYDETLPQEVRRSRALFLLAKAAWYMRNQFPEIGHNGLSTSLSCHAYLGRWIPESDRLAFYEEAVQLAIEIDLSLARQQGFVRDRPSVRSYYEQLLHKWLLWDPLNPQHE